MFQIQVLDRGQWRDDLVSNDAEDNQFGTREDAEEAMTALLAEADPRDRDVEWRIERSNELTAQERLDHHNAYHVSGMMDRECPDCAEILRLTRPTDDPDTFQRLAAEYFVGSSDL